jgi:hypothetical protein
MEGSPDTQLKPVRIDVCQSSFLKSNARPDTPIPTTSGPATPEVEYLLKIPILIPENTLKFL